MKLLHVMRQKEVMSLLNEEFMFYKNEMQKTEMISLSDATERVLAVDVRTYEDLPSFRRSSVDGYAVLSKDLEGCTDAMPAFLNVVGASVMGQETDLVLKRGSAVYVPTGGMVPNGADAVVMVEYTEKFDSEVAVHQPVAIRENVVGIGDDIHKGEVLLKKGEVIQAQHIGLLAALGYKLVSVIVKPKVAIISTGDELVAVSDTPKIGQVRDVNSLMLAEFAKRTGCKVVLTECVKDDKERIKYTLERALEIADIIIISGGSSVGEQDCTAEIINSLGSPGVLVHGVAIKPGKPTIAARIGNKALFGLPGHPAAAIISYKAVMEPFIIQNFLAKETKCDIRMEARSGFEISLGQGRDVYQMVKLIKEPDGLVAYPVMGKSGMLTLLSQADGYIVIPMEKELIRVGEQIDIKLF